MTKESGAAKGKGEKGVRERDAKWEEDRPKAVFSSLPPFFNAAFFSPPPETKRREKSFFLLSVSPRSSLSLDPRRERRVREMKTTLSLFLVVAKNNKILVRIRNWILPPRRLLKSCRIHYMHTKIICYVSPL